MRAGRGASAVAGASGYVEVSIVHAAHGIRGGGLVGAWAAVVHPLSQLALGPAEPDRLVQAASLQLQARVQAMGVGSCVCRACARKVLPVPSGWQELGRSCAGAANHTGMPGPPPAASGRGPRAVCCPATSHPHCPAPTCGGPGRSAAAGGRRGGRVGPGTANAAGGAGAPPAPPPGRPPTSSHSVSFTPVSGVPPSSSFTHATMPLAALRNFLWLPSASAAPCCTQASYSCALDRAYLPGGHGSSTQAVAAQVEQGAARRSNLVGQGHSHSHFPEYQAGRQTFTPQAAARELVSLEAQGAGGALGGLKVQRLQRHVLYRLELGVAAQLPYRLQARSGTSKSACKQPPVMCVCVCVLVAGEGWCLRRQ